MLKLLRRFAFAASGAAAVEFAMVMPFVVFLWGGASELSLAVTLNRKLDNTSALVNDLVTQTGKEGLNRAELNLIMDLAKASLEPFDSTRATLRVTSIHIEPNGTIKVDWSTDPRLYPRDVPMTGLPVGIAAQRGRYMVMTEAIYPYEPVLSLGIFGAYDMQRVTYFQPRVVDRVVCNDC